MESTAGDIRSRQDYDIVIVGAGPAGSTFARLLPSGVRALLLDGRGGRGKPCGGLLAPDAQKALARFDLTLPREILVDPQIFAVRTIDLGCGLERYYQRCYLNLDREKFDAWLRSLVPDSVETRRGRVCAARREGGGFVVEYREADGALRQAAARYLVGADGAGSFVRRTFFPAHRVREYVAIQQWFPEQHANPFYSCVFDRETTDCCSWSISKDNRFVFGGAFAPHGCRESFERQKQKLAAQFGFRFGEPLFTEACRVLRPSSPASFCCGEDGVFLLGEAAGFISPSSLEGISWAIRSAVALSRAFHAGRAHLHGVYASQTRGLRARLLGKRLKCPLMYQPSLRRLVLRSGISSIDLIVP